MSTASLNATEIACAKGRSAPRVSLADIKNAIAGENYFTAGEACAALNQPASDALNVLTICLITMNNGFTVIGKSAPASPENFSEGLGRELAYEDAVRQIWPLMGYALRDNLSTPAASLEESA